MPVANNRVTLRYQSPARRCERMSGGVPGWTWPELGPMVTDLDAVYVNFISGFELCLGTAEALRHGFAGPLYADLHSLFLGMGGDGMRVLRPLPNAPTWFAFFDVVQLNEEEMAQLGGDPLPVAADAIASGVSLLNVTVGARGVVYVARPGFEHIGDRHPGRRGRVGHDPHRTRLPAAAVDVNDPTGCGDVFGATCFARLLAGDDVDQARCTPPIGRARATPPSAAPPAWRTTFAANWCRHDPRRAGAAAPRPSLGRPARRRPRAVASRRTAPGRCSCDGVGVACGIRGAAHPRPGARRTGSADTGAGAAGDGRRRVVLGQGRVCCVTPRSSFSCTARCRDGGWTRLATSCSL